MSGSISEIVIPGKGGYPRIAILMWLGFIVYQIFVGKLFDLKWRAWVTRQEQPRKYWFALAIETLVVFLLVFMGALAL